MKTRFLGILGIFAVVVMLFGLLFGFGQSAKADVYSVVVSGPPSASGTAYGFTGPLGLLELKGEEVNILVFPVNWSSLANLVGQTSLDFQQVPWTTVNSQPYFARRLEFLAGLYPAYSAAAVADEIYWAGGVDVFTNPAISDEAFDVGQVAPYFVSLEAIGNTTFLQASNGAIVLEISSSSAVPEPATWAMMLLGFGALGFVGYRRNKAAHIA